MIYGTNSTRNNSVSTRSIGLLIMMDAIIDIMVSIAKVTVTRGARGAHAGRRLFVSGVPAVFSSTLLFDILS